MNRFILEMTACAALATGLAFAQSRATAAEPPTGSSLHAAEGGTASPLVDWLVNPSGEVDGVLLSDGRAFYFDPIVARTLLLSVRIGDPLRVAVREGQRTMIDERDGSTCSLVRFAHGGGPRPQAALQRMTTRGRIAAFLRQPEGNVTGFILATGEQVRVAPALGFRLAALHTGDTVVVEGFGRRGPYGVGMSGTSVRDDQGRVVL